MTKKRTFKNFRQFFKETIFMIKNTKQLRSAMKNRSIPPAFRERLMMAVTSVNNCRFCSYHHSKLALKEGINSEEAAKILEGCVDNCPPSEAPALLYAQGWAESNGNPSSATVQRMVEIYGKQTLRDIDSILLMIRMGNYMGNVASIMLEKMSFGKTLN
ncbi:MAG: carboxymuconolactone decarboxylase family protein [Caldisericia bacterium]|nr:carboxymuconolactone decarboxylase family protein [Caldisericia bacterium]